MNSFPNHIQRFKPAIGCGFITHLSPHTLLGIKSRLIRRKIFQVNPFVRPYETPNLFPFVPLSTIYIQPDFISPKPAIQLTEASQEAFSVPLRASEHSHSPQQRSNPSKNIQPVVMLTGSGDLQPPADFTPTSTQTRMQRKTGLIFKDDGFFSSQSPKFFLTLAEIFGRLRCVPEDTYTRLSSSDNPAGASMTAPDAPSDVFQIDISDGPPESDHPIEHDLDRTAQATSLNVLPTLGKFERSTVPGARVSLQVSKSTALGHSPYATTNSSFGELYQAPRLPIPDVDPPMSTKKPQSLSQPWLPEFPALLATNRLDLLRDARLSNWGFA